MTFEDPEAASQAYARAVAATVAGTDRAPRQIDELGQLRFENYRQPFLDAPGSLTDIQRTQIQSILGPDLPLDQLFEPDPSKDINRFAMRQLACIDIVDARTGALLQDLFLWPWGHGKVVHAGTLNLVTYISQHGVDSTEYSGKAWLEDFAKAWDEGADRLGYDANHIHFTADERGEPDDEED